MYKTKKNRLDTLIVQNQLLPDLATAQAYIMAGKVVVDDQRCDKPGILLNADSVIRIKTKTHNYASRSGQKLAAALEYFELTDWLRDKTVLDVGASTGGFTSVCLQHGAKKVFAVDVGTNQLEWCLRQDPRVWVYEKTDIRVFKLPPEQSLDLVVCDVSFIKVRSILESLTALQTSHKELRLCLLVKPQFELPADMVPDGGIVHSPELRAKAVADVTESLEAKGFWVAAGFESPLKGRYGNQEVFLYAKSQRPK